MLADGTRGSVLALESTWHFAMGRSVTSTIQLDAASEKSQAAALLPLQFLDASACTSRAPDFASLPSWSFLPRTLPTRISLLNNFNPRLGRQTQMNGLLVLHSAAPAQPPVVIVTITAL